MRRAIPLLLIIDACFERAHGLSRAISSMLACETTVALNCSDGVTLALGSKPRAALVDIGSAFDGIEAAAIILDRMDGKAPTLIAMAAESDLLLAAQAGIFDHALAKPVDKRRLVALLRSL